MINYPISLANIKDKDGGAKKNNFFTLLKMLDKSDE